MEVDKRQERLNLLKRIEEYEKSSRFNEDVEIDPPAKVINPKEVDYTNKKLSSKFLTMLANAMGSTFFKIMMKKKQLIIKEVYGIEYAKAIKGGAIVTCNHFNIADNYVVYRTIKPALKKRHFIYKVIKEGNYTSFKGPLRLMMRHGNTMPLSVNPETMKKFYEGMDTLLKRGEKILIYPEQAMWWNYKKPRPLKIGAFKLAAKYNVPIIPVFITMKDSSYKDDEGFPVQELYVHYLEPIFPKEELSEVDNTKMMMSQNYKAWVNKYEEFYNKKLEY